MKFGNLEKLNLYSFLRGMYFAIPIQTLFLLSKGLSFTQIMLLESALVLAIIFFEIPTGLVADRFGRKTSLIFCNLFNIISLFIWLFAGNFWIFALSFFLFGISISFASGAESALIYEELKAENKEDQMQKVYGKYMAASTLGLAIATFLAAFVITTQSIRVYYALYEVTFVFEILSLIAALFVKEPRRIVDATKGLAQKAQMSFKMLGAGFKLLKENKLLRKLLIIELIAAPMLNLLLVFYQPYFQQSHVPSIWLGFATSISYIFVMFSLYFAHRIEHFFGLRIGLLLANILPVLGFIAIAFFSNPAIAVLLFIATNALGNIKYPIFSDLENGLMKDEYRATALSTFTFVTSLFLFLIRPVFGWVADYRLSLMFLGVGVLSLIGYIFIRFTKKDMVGFGRSRVEANPAEAKL